MAHSSHVTFARWNEMGDNSIMEHVVDVLSSGAGVNHGRLFQSPIRGGANL